MNVAYWDLYTGIQEDWQQLSHIMNQQIPAFLPNRIIHSSKGPRTIVGPSRHIWYLRKQYEKEPQHKRELATLFTAISAIGGLITKGVDVYNNWK